MGCASSDSTDGVAVVGARYCTEYLRTGRRSLSRAASATATGETVVVGQLWADRILLHRPFTRVSLGTGGDGANSRLQVDQVTR